jgi:hypothetical protein
MHTNKKKEKIVIGNKIISVASANGAIWLCGCMPMMFQYSYFQNPWSKSFNKSFRFEHLVETGHKFHCAMLLNHNLGCFQVSWSIMSLSTQNVKLFSPNEYEILEDVCVGCYFQFQVD